MGSRRAMHKGGLAVINERKQPSDVSGRYAAVPEAEGAIRRAFDRQLSDIIDRGPMRMTNQSFWWRIRTTR